MPLLKEKVVATSITTRTQYNATTWDTTTDKMFLLSEADLFGTHNRTKTTNTKDYTYGNKVLVTNINMRKSNVGALLRTPSFSDKCLVRIDQTGDYKYLFSPYGFTYYSFPALWVTMPA